MIIGGKLVKQYTIDKIINRDVICSINAMYSDGNLFGAVLYKYNLILTYVKIQLQDSP